MIKRSTKYLGIIVLVLFSFYYTDKAVDIVKRNDPLMLEILNNSDNYKVESISATIKDDTIIPGVNGVVVDVDSSYKRMKQVNAYYESMLIFSEVIPDESVLERYDKFIIGGNSSRSDIALLLKVSNLTNLENIYNVFLKKNAMATFFVDGSVVEDNMDLIYEIIKDGYEIENYGYNGEYNDERFKWTNNMLYSLTNLEPKFCYSDYYNYDVLKLCSKNRMYTVKPTLNVVNNPFYTIKSNLKEGSIISLSLTDETVKELPTIISYIRQKGYNLTTLSEIISEDRIEEK